MKLHSPDYVRHKLRMYGSCNKGSVPIDMPCSLCLWAFKVEERDVQCVFSNRFYYFAKGGVK